MDKKWTQLDPPSTCPPPLPIRGMTGLARSEHPAFPETAPYAGSSVPSFAPSHTTSPESAGKLAREIMENELGRHPALILKNLPIHCRRDFSRFVEVMALVRHGYEGGVALRDQANDGVNVASTEPPEVVISPHNEFAYMPSPPAIVIFHCMQAASHGGEVPVNDARKIPASLPVEFVREMRTRGVRYSRRVPRKNASLEVGWEHQFSTTEKAVVERHLTREGITYYWEADDLLRFWFERPVFRTYRDEEVWFNQISESNADLR